MIFFFTAPFLQMVSDIVPSKDPLQRRPKGDHDTTLRPEHPFGTSPEPLLHADTGFWFGAFPRDFNGK